MEINKNLQKCSEIWQLYQEVTVGSLEKQPVGSVYLPTID